MKDDEGETVGSEVGGDEGEMVGSEVGGDEGETVGILVVLPNRIRLSITLLRGHEMETE